MKERFDRVLSERITRAANQPVNKKGDWSSFQQHRKRRLRKNYLKFSVFVLSLLLTSWFVASQAGMLRSPDHESSTLPDQGKTVKKSIDDALNTTSKQAFGAKDQLNEKETQIEQSEGQKVAVEVESSGSTDTHFLDELDDKKESSQHMTYQESAKTAQASNQNQRELTVPELYGQGNEEAFELPSRIDRIPEPGLTPFEGKPTIVKDTSLYFEEVEPVQLFRFKISSTLYTIPEGQLQNNLNLATGFGLEYALNPKLSLEVRLLYTNYTESFPINRNIGQSDTTITVLTASEARVSNLSMPVQLNYRIGKSELSPHIYLGIGSSISLSESYTELIENRRQSRVEITTNELEYGLFERFYWASHLRLGLGKWFRLGNNQLEADFNYSIPIGNSLNNNDIRFALFGFSLSYYFK